MRRWFDWLRFHARRKTRRNEKWLVDYQRVLSSADTKSRFDAIYRERIWSRIGQTSETESGAGSTLKASAVFRKEIERYLAGLPPGVFFDAPCGDFNVMGNVNLPPDWQYLGADIAPSLIADLRRKYPGRRFQECDITSDPFPDASVWLCRACLFHLSFADIRKALANFSRSNIALALITTHVGVEQNLDIVTGDYRPLDLTLPPINLPKPRTILKDVTSQTPIQVVGVWRRQEIASTQ